MGGIHPPVSSRKEAGQPSTQPSAPVGSSCGGSSGPPPPLFSEMASPQVGKLRPSRSRCPQFLLMASSASLPAQIRQPGSLLWAPPLGPSALCQPERASRCPSTSRPVLATPDPCRGPRSPRVAPRPPQGPRKSNVGCSGSWSQTPGLWSGQRGGLSGSGKSWAGQGGPLPAPQPGWPLLLFSLNPHVHLELCLCPQPRPRSLMTTPRDPRRGLGSPGPLHRAQPAHGSSPGQAGWGSASPPQRTSHPAGFWRPGGPVPEWQPPPLPRRPVRLPC